MQKENEYPWFVRKDIDGFFGLGLDNLIQFILIVTLTKTLCHLPNTLIFGRILPGAALSILVGNLFYSWQARRLALRTKCPEVTALPYGINTVSLIAYIFFIMAPVYQETKDPVFAWKVGLLACFGSGIIEFLGAFIGEKIRRITPRAALLSTLAGIAIAFLSMEFSLQIYDKPSIAMLPMVIIFVQYFSRTRFPFGLPGGLVAVLVGSLLAWLLGYMKGLDMGLAEQNWIGLYLPKFSGRGIIDILKSGLILRYMSIIIPMGLFNVVGSLQNIESAEAGGDKFNTFSSLAVNGIGSMVAALFGSTFPTTIYIGHPGWKALGARWGYSIINGVFVTVVCLTGTISFILRLIPLEAGIGILLWIGIVIVAQAFQEVPKAHAPAVAIGIFPALAAWGLLMVENALRASQTSIFNLSLKSFEGIIPIHGLISLERGFIFTSMILASIAVFLIERKFLSACLWALVAVLFSFFGFIHAYQISPAGISSRLGLGVSPGYTLAYFLFALFFLLMHFWINFEKKTKRKIEEE